MLSWKRIGQSRWVQTSVGALASQYINLVIRTNRFVIEPDDFYERVDAPFIVTFWHGQHLLTPFIKRPLLRAKVLVSRHRDGEVNAIAAERLGIGIIRGSGDHGNEYRRKGGVAAFRAMLAALGDGYNMALTAD